MDCLGFNALTSNTSLLISSFVFTIIKVDLSVLAQRTFKFVVFPEPQPQAKTCLFE